MNEKEIAMIKSYLNEDDLVFEWGAGGSTITFSKLVHKYVSVEHDKAWFDIVSNEIRNRNLRSKVSLYHVPQNQPRTIPTKPEQFHDYINFFPNEYEGLKFDKVLCDGRARQFCSISALKFLKPDGLLFIHDYFNRPHYKSVEEHYALVDKVDTTDQTLGVFRPL